MIRGMLNFRQLQESAENIEVEQRIMVFPLGTQTLRGRQVNSHGRDGSFRMTVITNAPCHRSWLAA